MAVLESAKLFCPGVRTYNSTLATGSVLPLTEIFAFKGTGMYRFSTDSDTLISPSSLEPTISTGISPDSTTVPHTVSPFRLNR